MKPIDCPFGSQDCPKVSELRTEVESLKRNQIVMMRTIYYIAGIVSVSLGVTVLI